MLFQGLIVGAMLWLTLWLAKWFFLLSLAALHHFYHWIRRTPTEQLPWTAWNRRKETRKLSEHSPDQRPPFGG